MARGRHKSLVGQLSDRALIARRCGARMFSEGKWWAPDMVDGGPALDAWLTEAERAARASLLPATWAVNWFHGWNDAAAEAAETGE